MLAVVERVRDSSNELAVVVPLAAGAEASVVPGDGAGVRSGGGSDLGISRSSRGGEGQAKAREGGGNEGNHFG